MDLQTQLSAYFPADRLKTRLIDRHSYARDASFYRLIPQAIVQPETEAEIQQLFRISQDTQIPLVFRAAGTSLSGQSITDGILVEVARRWQNYHYDEQEQWVQLQPGLIGGNVNRKLAQHGRKIGPDPASLDACMVGGIVANNASGMCCGVRDNAYHTLESVRFILPNGQIYNSADQDADERLQQESPDIHAGLLRLKQELEANPELSGRIRDKYSRKKTLGYSLNAFLDFDRPMDILSHLLVGSEGTLGFVSEVRLKTLPDHPFKAAALLFFEDIRKTAESVPLLEKSGAEALEIMDRAALSSIQDLPGMPSEIKSLPSAAAGLLCEFQASNEDELEQKVQNGLDVLKECSLLHQADFAYDESTRLKFWKVRKGLLPSVGAVRKSGTTVIIEDICFRLENLADAILDLQQLFVKHGYKDAIIFGHAKDGNLHFVISQTFAGQAGQQQYEAFMEDLVNMTVGTYDGALKAEHGTGRNMAPFLETEWGGAAVEVMRELKDLIDPQNLLNPGVILNDDPHIHLKDLKPTPTVEAVVDKCIECGFCETWCPSQDLSMSPRRRIATLREIQFLEAGDYSHREIARFLKKDYGWESVDTCAVDGLCALGCPVGIDTGELTRHFRSESNSVLAKTIASWTVRYFSFVTQMIRFGLNLASPFVRLMGRDHVQKISNALYERSKGVLPVWHRFMPRGGRGLPLIPIRNVKGREEMVYFASCINRSMDRIPGESSEQSASEAFISILQEAGIHPIYPAHLEELCCGTPYSSKGFNEEFRKVAEKTVRSLWRSSGEGKLPIVVDTSPCTQKMQHYDEILTGEVLEQWRSLKILDIIEYFHDSILPRLEARTKVQQVVLHPTCSVRKMGLTDKMIHVAEFCAHHVIVPEEVGCCGFAGDRGFLVPELTESATAREAAEVKSHSQVDGCYSSSRTCEMGMSQATDMPYSSIIQLLYETRND